MPSTTPLCSNCQRLGTPISVEAHNNMIAAIYRCTQCGHEWEVSAPTVADLFKTDLSAYDLVGSSRRH